MQNFLDGKKTYIGLTTSAIFYLLQVTGNANWISEADLNETINVVVQLAFLLSAAYARYLATKNK